MSPNRQSLRLLNGVAACGALFVVGAIGMILWRAQRAATPLGLPQAIQNSRDLVAKAHDAVGRGRFEEAEAFYLDALRARPSHSLSLDLAALYVKHHQDAKAIEIYDRTIGKEPSPRDMDALFRYGEACVGVGRRTQARAIFHRIVWGAATDPKDADRSLEQLWSAACVRDSRERLTVRGEQRALLEKAVHLDPRNWDAYTAIVEETWFHTPEQRDRKPALAQLHRFRRAVEAFRDPKGWVAYARALYWNGRKRGALALLNDRYRSANAADRLVLGDGIAGFQIQQAYSILNAHRQEAAPAIAYIQRCFSGADAHERVVLESAIGDLQAGEAELLFFQKRVDEAITYLDRLLQKPGGNTAKLRTMKGNIQRWRKTGYPYSSGMTGVAQGPSRALLQDTP